MRVTLRAAGVAAAAVLMTTIAPATFSDTAHADGLDLFQGFGAYLDPGRLPAADVTCGRTEG